MDSVKAFIDKGVLSRGDVLVMDNASVHVGQIATAALSTLLEDNGIELALLPTYSPELNPCEFVFARIKWFIRSPYATAYCHHAQREVSRTFNDLLVSATSVISYESMAGTYAHCSRLDPESHVAKVLVNRQLVSYQPDPVDNV